MDTGFIECKQPNGITFTARQYGDVFENWMETKDGYQIIINYNDGYNYYARLGKDGDFVPSSSKAVIDKPIESSKRLQSSESKWLQLRRKGLILTIV